MPGSPGLEPGGMVGRPQRGNPGLFLDGGNGLLPGAPGPGRIGLLLVGSGLLQGGNTGGLEGQGTGGPSE